MSLRVKELIDFVFEFLRPLVCTTQLLSPDILLAAEFFSVCCIGRRMRRAIHSIGHLELRSVKLSVSLVAKYLLDFS